MNQSLKGEFQHFWNKMWYWANSFCNELGILRHKLRLVTTYYSGNVENPFFLGLAYMKSGWAGKTLMEIYYTQGNLGNGDYKMLDSWYILGHPNGLEYMSLKSDEDLPFPFSFRLTIC